MKKILTSLTLAILTSFSALAGTIVLEGTYQKENLYIVNSIAESGVGYCVYEVLVNGEVTSDEVNSQAFEIDLSIYNFRQGQDLVVTIKYKDGCEPKVLNEDALSPKPSFEIVEIDANRDGALEWTTKNEKGRLPFIVQQFKWNKWVDIGEVMGKGESGKNNYSFQVSPVSGKNQVRVVQKTKDGDVRPSPVTQFNSTKKAVSYSYDKKSSALTFTEETSFELYNGYGQIVKRGKSASVDMSAFPEGEYYISFDSSTEKFIHK
jgi:hypothetical protein